MNKNILLQQGRLIMNLVSWEIVLLRTRNGLTRFFLIRKPKIIFVNLIKLNGWPRLDQCRGKIKDHWANIIKCLISPKVKLI